ncbi:hypothetical protein [Kitasatospora nipponensis]|uniref:hypothetical protein n=1 Tax=Kitasatospora nipponensis TaxID=258049 RepID=UPI0031D0185C
MTVQTEFGPLPTPSASGPLPCASEDTPVLPAPPRIAADLTRDLGGAAGAVRAMPPSGGPRADVTIAAYAAVVCTGSSAADALEQAARWCRQARQAEIHATTWARIPGHREDLWEYQLSLQVSFPDPETGEHSAHTHHGARPRS